MDQSEAMRLAQICLPKMDTTVKITDIINVQFQSICRLWAGMGYIYLVTITTTTPTTKSTSRYQFIIKRVILPPVRKKRNVGDERKAQSYIIEANFYNHLVPSLIKEYGLLLPMPYHIEQQQDNDNDDRVTICMSYLEGSMSPQLSANNNKHDVYSVLTWLATFHAATWSTVIDHKYLIEHRIIQPIGSYWHLTTRTTEHAAMSSRGWEGRLKMAACAIDERLRRDTMQCCIHGDAKEANMLFIHKDGTKKKKIGGDRSSDGGDDITVGMYDYQYCGKAPPTVDLAYYFCVSSSVQSTNCYREYLQYYHQQLLSKLNCCNDTRNTHHSALPQHELPTLDALEESLELALADFQRFLCGWGQWGSDILSIVIKVLNRLDGGTILTSEDEYRLAMLREYG
jgi:thiamine kinase-like enzyme